MWLRQQEKKKKKQRDYFQILKSRLFQGDIESRTAKKSIEEAFCEGNITSWYTIAAWLSEGSAIFRKNLQTAYVSLSASARLKNLSRLERRVTFHKKHLFRILIFGKRQQQRQMFAKITVCCDDFFFLCRKSRCKPRLYIRKCCRRSWRARIAGRASLQMYACKSVYSFSRISFSERERAYVFFDVYGNFIRFCRRLPYSWRLF